MEGNLLLIGEYVNNYDIIDNFLTEKECTPWVKYYRSDKDKLQKIKILAYEKIVENDPTHSKSINNIIDTLKKMSSDEYFEYISIGCSYDDLGNAISMDNPNGFLDSYSEANLIKSKKGGLVQSTTLHDWSRDLSLDYIDKIKDIWLNKEVKYVEFCKKFATFEDLLSIYRPKFNSVIFKSEWLEFDIDSVEGSIEFNELIKKIDMNEKISSYTYSIK